MKNISTLFKMRIITLVLILPTFLLNAQAPLYREGFNNTMNLFTRNPSNGGAFYNGNSNNNDRPANSPFFTEGTRGFGISDAPAVILTTVDLNTSLYTNVRLSFRLAAFSIGATNNGLDKEDYVRVEISPDGGVNYYNTMEVTGNNNVRWAYSASGTATTSYDGDGNSVIMQPPNPGGNQTISNGYSTVTIDNLPSSANLKVKITLYDDDSKERWVIDDFQIVARMPEINVLGQTGSNLLNGDVSPTYFMGTEFGRVLTSTGTVTNSFTIQNLGNANLTVSGVTFTGPDASAFSVTATPASSVIPNGNTNFSVTFDPNSVGYKTATVNIANNDNDENPYTFKVQGYGVDCNMNVDIVAIQNFDNNGTSTLPVAGAYTAVAGNSGNSIYPRNQNMFLGVRAWQIQRQDVTLDFGAVNLTNVSGVQFLFDLAAFSTQNNDGPSGNDYIVVYVSGNNGVTWSTEFVMWGYDQFWNSYSQYQFGSAAAADTTYNGLNVPVYYRNGNFFNYGVGTVVVNIPENKVTNNMKFSIRAISSRNQAIWLIDNVRVIRRDNPITKTFSAGLWKNQLNANTTAPTIAEKAIINDNFIGEDLSTCDCTVNAGKILTISSGKYADINSNIDNKGTIVVESDGSLLQRSDLGTYTSTAGATFTVKRNANLKRLDYNYWASPVVGQNLKTFSPGTLNNRFYTYNESNDLFDVIDPVANNFADNGKGYAIRAFNTYGTTSQVFGGKFVGVPHNGVKSIGLSVSPTTPPSPPNPAYEHGYNLIGNPYASNLDFYALHASNSALIYNTAYFWTNINPNPPMEGSGYPNGGYLNNYAVLNGTGGVGATSTAPVGGNIPNQYVKVGQGFIVKAKAAGNLSFKNAVRTNNSSSIFFNKNGQSVDRYWLNLTTPLEVMTTQLIGYKEEATNGFEFDYDAPLIVLGADAFYSILDDKRLAIQGKAPFVNTDIVPLGSSHYETGNYTISLGAKEGIFANGQTIYLNDKQTNTVTNLSEGNYTFAANQGLSEGRFEIIYQPEVVLGTGVSLKENLIVYRDGNDFVVKSSVKNVTSLEVYDVSGRLIIKLNPNHKEVRIDATGFINGVYVLKVNREGNIVTKKVIK